MLRDDSEATVLYLNSLDSGGGPSQKEIACLERASMWEETLAFLNEIGWGDGGGVTISPPNPPLEKGGDKGHRLEACATGDARPIDQKPKTKNQKRLLQGMSRAVARDLGLI